VVVAAYGWEDTAAAVHDTDILQRLLALHVTQ